MGASAVQIRFAEGYHLAPVDMGHLFRSLMSRLDGVDPPSRLRHRDEPVEVDPHESEVIEFATRASPFDPFEWQRLRHRDTVERLVERGLLERVDLDHGGEQFAKLTRRPDCAQLFVVLTGERGQLSEAHDRFLAETGLLRRNLLLLRDVTGHDYEAGVSESVRSFEALVGWIDGVRRGLGIALADTFLVGNSMGGHAALSLGHRLGAAEVWAFAPRRIGRADGGTGARNGHAGTETRAEVLLAEANGTTRYNVFYNESFEPDRVIADGLVRLPGVHLHPQQGEHHAVLADVLDTGAGPSLLPPYVERRRSLVADSPEERRAAVVEQLALLTGRAAVELEVGSLDLDSLGIVHMVDFAEMRLGVLLPDSAAETFKDGTLAEVIALIETTSVPRSADGAGTAEGGTATSDPALPVSADPIAVSAPLDGDRRSSDGSVVTDVEIGMPLLGRNNLAEVPLLKLVADIQWRHLAMLSGVPSARTIDDEGNRLYATVYFVEVVAPGPAGLAAHGENDRLRLHSDLYRFGRSLLEGHHVFAPLAADGLAADGVPGRSNAQASPTVRMSNTFVRQWDGAGWLKKARPAAAGFARIPEVDDPPPGYRLSQAAQNGERLLRLPEGAKPLRSEAGTGTSAAATFAYAIDPERDVNGAGLLYFAHYPLFLDRAERELLLGLGLSDELLARRSLLHRRSAYLANASADDTLEVTARPSLCVERATDSTPAATLHVDFTMRRLSDGRPMLVSSVVKTFTDPTAADLAALTQLLPPD